MFVVRELKGEADLVALQQLRADVYLEKGYLSGDDLTEGRDVDPYDAGAHHVGVFLPGGEAVGTLRLIPAGCRLGLQIEHYCDEMELSPRATAVEASRFVVHSDHRKSVVTHGLIRWAIAKMEDLGIERCFALVENGLFQNFLSMGLPFEQMGPPIKAFRSENIPIVASVPAMLASVEQVDLNRPVKLAKFLRGRPIDGLITEDMIHGS